MAQTRAEQISDLHHRALARAPADRERFLREACRDDEALRQEIESLRRFESAADGFLERPAVAALADGRGSDVTRAFAAAGMVGRTLGSYTITACIGAGGMGEVYRARDSKLGRDVAIKVLPLSFASDPDRRSRFAREARVLATLNHPNIGAIYGLEEAEGVTALVLELVEGETLAHRLERGPLPVFHSLLIAAQIVDALDAAHEKGIVYRDLKPANIVLQGGTDARSSVSCYSDPARDVAPVWKPDGSEIAFARVESSRGPSIWSRRRTPPFRTTAPGSRSPAIVPATATKSGSHELTVPIDGAPSYARRSSFGNHLGLPSGLCMPLAKG